MRIRTKEEMRVYQRARRTQFKKEGKPTNWKRGLVKVEPKLTIEVLKSLRKDTIPLSVVGFFLYFLFSDDVLVYVGQSRSLLQRIIAHKNGTHDSPRKEFNSISLVESTKETINNEELEYIKWYSPKYNKVGIILEAVEVPVLVTPCSGCLERDLQIKKLIVRVAFLEKSMERYVDIDTRVKNPKKFGGNWL